MDTSNHQTLLETALAEAKLHSFALNDELWQALLRSLQESEAQPDSTRFELCQQRARLMKAALRRAQARQRRVRAELNARKSQP